MPTQMPPPRLRPPWISDCSRLWPSSSWACLFSRVPKRRRQSSGLKADRLRARRRSAHQGPLRQMPHRRHLQGLVLARYPRDDAQVEGRRPGEERRERAARAAHVRRPRVSHAPQGTAAHGRRGRPAHGVDRPGSPLGRRVHVQAAGLHGPAQAPSPQAARRRATAATIRSTASSTPISPRTESRRPLRSTTRRLLAGRSST